MTDVLISTTELNDKTYELYESTEVNPEVFVDAIQGIAVRGATVRVNFTRDIINYNAGDDSKLKRAVAVRLVMPIGNYIDVIEFLHKNLQELKEVIEIQQKPGQKPS